MVIPRGRYQLSMTDVDSGRNQKNAKLPRKRVSPVGCQIGKEMDWLLILAVSSILQTGKENIFHHFPFTG